MRWGPVRELDIPCRAETWKSEIRKMGLREYMKIVCIYILYQIFSRSAACYIDCPIFGTLFVGYGVYISKREPPKCKAKKKSRKKSRHHAIFILMNHLDVVGHKHNKRTHINGMTNSLLPGGIR